MVITKAKIGTLLKDKAVLDIKDGNHGAKHPRGSDFKSEGVPFIVAQNIREGNIDFVGCSHITRQQAETLKKGRAINGDVLLTHKGTVGSTAIVKDIEGFLMLSPQVTYYRVDDSKLYNKYLRYAFMEPTFQSQLASYSAQSTRPYISISSQRDLEIYISPLATQRKIASILSGYDDLIENNLRRIKILEEMAQLLYREWFVNFRFPRQDNSQFGGTPTDWPVSPIHQLAEILRDTISPQEFKDEDFNYFSFPAFDDEMLPSLTRGELIQSAKFLIKEDCVLLSKLNPQIPRIWLVNRTNDRRSIASTEFLVLREKNPKTRYFLYCSIASLEFQKRFVPHRIGTSTSHQRVKPGDFLRIELSLPPIELMTEFNEFIAPFLDEAIILRRAGRLLRQTRDFLLPKLISGQLDVSDLDIAVTEDQG